MVIRENHADNLKRLLRLLFIVSGAVRVVSPLNPVKVGVLRSNLLISLILLSVCLLLAGCKKKADAVLLVKEDVVTVKGRAEVVFEPGGGYSMNAWVPGNIVIFRVDKTVDLGSGKAGTVYIIDQNRKLQSIDTVDLKKSDDELVAQYLKSK